jgi:hypothetical protein
VVTAARPCDPASAAASSMPSPGPSSVRLASEPSAAEDAAVAGGIVTTSSPAHTLSTPATRSSDGSAVMALALASCSKKLALARPRATPMLAPPYGMLISATVAVAAAEPGVSSAAPWAGAITAAPISPAASAQAPARVAPPSTPTAARIRTSPGHR